MIDLSSNTALPGITLDEYTKLLLSVGGTSKDRRPNPPVEVGEVLSKAKSAGATTKILTAGMHMTDTSMPGKFLRLACLNESILHLVTWGATDRKALGFSVAHQISRIEKNEQQLFAEQCLAHRITKDQAVSVIQLYQRSGQSLEECFARVVARKPTTRTMEVILGSLTLEPYLLSTLESMSQLERDQLFEQVVTCEYPDASNFSAKLGKNRFTIIGEKSVRQFISSDKLFSEKLNSGLRTLMSKDK